MMTPLHTPPMSLNRQLLLYQKLDALPSPHIPSPPPSPIPCTPPPTTTPNSPGFCFTGFANPMLDNLLVLQSQIHSFLDEVRVIFASLSDQLTQMETRLSAKLDIVDVQTKYIDKDEPAV